MRELIMLRCHIGGQMDGQKRKKNSLKGPAYSKNENSYF